MFTQRRPSDRSAGSLPPVSQHAVVGLIGGVTHALDFRAKPRTVDASGPDRHPGTRGRNTGEGACAPRFALTCSAEKLTAGGGGATQALIGA
jgi:hypothetical protein